MEKYEFDKNNGLWYELQGDYYLPCLKLQDEEQAHIGIWGQRHLRYLKEHHRVRYANLLTSGTTHPDEHNAEEYASDRVEGGVDRITHEAAHQFDKQGSKGLEETKRNVSKAKDGIQRFREKRAAKSIKRRTVRTSGNKTVKAVEQTEKTIKQSARSAGKKTIKTAGKGAAKAAQRSVKTTKTAIKTTQQAAKTAQKTAQATVKASQKAAQAAKATAKAAVAGVKAAVKATIAAVKAIIAATKALVAAIAAGGWVAVAVIVVICLIALICGSVFGIFFSGEDSGTGMSMQTAVQEINADYNAKMEAEKNSVAYDNMEISGGRAVWKDEKLNTKLDNFIEMRAEDEISKDLFKKKTSELELTMQKLDSEIKELKSKQEPEIQIEDYAEKLTVLQYALEQYTNWDDKDIPESVIEAFVVKIVASKDGFDWYLRFNGNPDDPLHCTVGGKRKSTATISVAGECSPAVHKGNTGRHPRTAPIRS